MICFPYMIPNFDLREEIGKNRVPKRKFKKYCFLFVYPL